METRVHGVQIGSNCGKCNQGRPLVRWATIIQSAQGKVIGREPEASSDGMF